MFDLWDFICEYILPIFFVILIILEIILITGTTIILYKRYILKQADKIQNLEEKLNIYERSYEDFCLEDSIRQSDAYE